MEERRIPDLRPYLANDGLLTNQGVVLVQEEIWDFYGHHARSFLWRETSDPYHVFVSEVMLQQTQTDRVSQKFSQFIEHFPNFKVLADAPLSEVLILWQGLGYNRRARALHESARTIVDVYHGRLPDRIDLLDELPGIGPATAASIAAFAFNQATTFVETNVRAVFITLCFSCSEVVCDSQILPLVAQTCDREHARHWYYALMDYGVMVKKRFKNPTRKSKQYARQSKFEGSERQIRGMIIRLLIQKNTYTFNELCQAIDRQQARVEKNLRDLCCEGLVCEKEGFFSLPAS